MSLLLLLDSKGSDGGTSNTAPDESGLLQAIIDAIHGSDDKIAGQRMTRVVETFLDSELDAITVESTLGFGEENDDLNDALLLVGGEIVYATARVEGPGIFRFCNLTRGMESTEVKTHPIGTLVFDLSGNTSALDLARRGFMVDTAVGSDLDVIGRNLGLDKCPGITDAQWRAVIKAVAYLPKQPIDAFNQALTALVGEGNYEVTESLITDPYTVFVRISTGLSATLQGRFVLNSGEKGLNSGPSEVTVTYDVVQSPLSDTLTELGVLPDLTVEGHTLSFPASGTGTDHAKVVKYEDLTLRGYRDGFLDYRAGGGAIVSNVIPLGTPHAGAALLVDYGGFSAHYLAENETRRHDADFYAYLADPLLAARCLLDQIRAAGVRVDLATLL